MAKPTPVTTTTPIIESWQEPPGVYMNHAHTGALSRFLPDKRLLITSRLPRKPMNQPRERARDQLLVWQSHKTHIRSQHKPYTQPLSTTIKMAAFAVTDAIYADVVMPQLTLYAAGELTEMSKEYNNNYQSGGGTTHIVALVRNRTLEKFIDVGLVPVGQTYDTLNPRHQQPGCWACGSDKLVKYACSQ